MTQYTIPLGFITPKYLLVYDDRMATADMLSDEMIEDIAASILRVVDLETYQEVLPDLTLADLEDESEEED